MSDFHFQTPSSHGDTSFETPLPSIEIPPSRKSSRLEKYVLAPRLTGPDAGLFVFAMDLTGGNMQRVQKLLAQGGLGVDVSLLSEGVDVIDWLNRATANSEAGTHESIRKVITFHRWGIKLQSIFQAVSYDLEKIINNEDSHWLGVAMDESGNTTSRYDLANPANATRVRSSLSRVDRYFHWAAYCLLEVYVDKWEEMAARLLNVAREATSARALDAMRFGNSTASATESNESLLNDLESTLVQPIVLRRPNEPGVSERECNYLDPVTDALAQIFSAAAPASVQGDAEARRIKREGPQHGEEDDASDVDEPACSNSVPLNSRLATLETQFTTFKDQAIAELDHRLAAFRSEGDIGVKKQADDLIRLHHERDLELKQQELMFAELKKQKANLADVRMRLNAQTQRFHALETDVEYAPKSQDEVLERLRKLEQSCSEPHPRCLGSSAPGKGQITRESIVQRLDKLEKKSKKISQIQGNIAQQLNDLNQAEKACAEARAHINTDFALLKKTTERLSQSQGDISQQLNEARQAKNTFSDARTTINRRLQKLESRRDIASQASQKSEPQHVTQAQAGRKRKSFASRNDDGEQTNSGRFQGKRQRRNRTLSYRESCT